MLCNNTRDILYALSLLLRFINFFCRCLNLHIAVVLFPKFNTCTIAIQSLYRVDWVMMIVAREVQKKCILIGWYLAYMYVINNITPLPRVSGK